MHFGIGGRVHIGTTVRPGDEQRSILLKKDAVLDESERQEQIG
jgi:hypothetical protein